MPTGRGGHRPARAGMESCCRACLPCCSCLWDRIWPGLRYPGPRDRDHVIANPAAHAAEIRTVSGDIRVPAPKKRPAQLYAALFDFEARSDDELTVKEGDKLSVIEKRGRYVLAKKLTGSLESGLVPANYLNPHPPSCPWYYGNINRGKAETLLLASQNKDGAFLVRISESHSDDSSLCVTARSEGKVFHFRVQRSSIGAYFISDKISFSTLGELIAYYQKNSRSLGVLLEEPCAQQVGLKQTSFSLCRRYFLTRLPLFSSVCFRLFISVLLSDSELNHKEFHREVQILKRLRHRHLISLFAVCTATMPYYIITELMEKGSLLKFLRSKPQLCSVCCFMVTASASRRHFRDGFDISDRDFTYLTSILYSRDPFYISEDKKIPYKWSAPEAISHGKFSIKSDVWSFGILLYEIITSGGVPYPGYNQEVYQQVTLGYRMPKPPNCPDFLYEIMKRCWSNEPADRPDFRVLRVKLEANHLQITAGRKTGSQTFICFVLHG
uniref:Tyrosine-protein kinase n=1 Tax=Neolamprologus brichardi TaxID=32507 RepID=A0A3Q4H572_NEOBR